MRRTERLQGLRLMKFEDVYGRCYRGDLSQAEASEILGMSVYMAYSTLPRRIQRRIRQCPKNARFL